jgi:hypothetical protein
VRGRNQCDSISGAWECAERPAIWSKRS